LVGNKQVFSDQVAWISLKDCADKFFPGQDERQMSDSLSKELANCKARPELKVLSGEANLRGNSMAARLAFDSIKACEEAAEYFRTAGYQIGRCRSKQIADLVVHDIGMKRNVANEYY
jgi:hypothetical protein